MACLLQPMRAFLAGVAFFTLSLVTVAAADRLGELQAQFANEQDPVRKAKLLTKLGEAQFELIRRQAAAGNYAQALQVLEQYGDAARTAHAGLKASGRDAVKKPEGFKHLQIHVRKSIRQLEQTILNLPFNQRDAFEAVRRRLEEIDKELIDLLFPRQPGKEKPKK